MDEIVFIVLPFFALVLTGYGAARGAVIEASGVLGLNKFVFYFALPALLFSKMAETPIAEVSGESIFVVAYTCTGLVVFALAWGGAKIALHAPTDQLAVMALGGIYGNIGFMGIPLLVTIMGREVAAPLSLMLLIDIAVFIPLATTLIDMSRTSERSHRLVGGVVVSIMKNPLIASIVLGLGFSALGWGLPQALGGFTNLLGQAAAPTAMFALGAAMAGRPLADGFGEAVLVTVFKLAFYPAAVWLGMGLFGIGDVWRLAATLGAATPVAAALFVIAQEYDAMPVRASTAVVLTTAISLLSLPVLIAWLT